MSRFVYPPARKADQVDVYHGQAIADPYRWLEDPKSAETKDWIEAENAITFDFLNNISGRDRLEKRLTELWNFEKYGTPFREGDRYFYFKNDGLQNQSVLYVQESLESEAQVLLDPNTLSDDGTVALAGLAISDNGRYLAYGLSEAGSDWTVWQVRDIETGNDLSDRLEWIKFSGASWTDD
ncbi:MAG: S9 family peptidase, partial [Cyanobacteria bacterium P01_H01_bin.15]